MKLFRIAVLMLLLHATIAPFVPRPAVAASADGTEVTADAGGPEASATAPDDPGGMNSKGGVGAALGCGFAVASLILAPNPVSGFLVGFNCGLMLIDAGYSPDR